MYPYKKRRQHQKTQKKIKKYVKGKKRKHINIKNNTIIETQNKKKKKTRKKSIFKKKEKKRQYTNIKLL